MNIPLYDWVAALGFAALLIGLLVLAGLGRPAPDYLTDAFKISIGLIFRTSVAVANEYRHR